jgi:hypothetical protein
MKRMVTAILILALAGCGSTGQTPKSIAATSYAGMPSGLPADTIRSGATTAVWTDGTLELVIWGSGSCPAVPVAMTATDANTVEITVDTDYGRTPCTADMSPTTWVLELPEEVQDVSILTVKVQAEGATPIVLRVRPST